MWILTKSGSEAFDTAKMYSLFVVEEGKPAVRCGLDGQKPMTLGSCSTGEQCRAVLKNLVKLMELGKAATQMPDDAEAARLAEAENIQPKERAANGKKTVRRGGS